MVKNEKFITGSVYCLHGCIFIMESGSFVGIGYVAGNQTFLHPLAANAKLNSQAAKGSCSVHV